MEISCWDSLRPPPTRLSLWLILICILLYNKTVIISITLSWVLWVILETIKSEGWVGTPEFVASWSEIGGPEFVAGVWCEGCLTWELCLSPWVWQTHWRRHFQEFYIKFKCGEIGPLNYLFEPEGKGGFASVWDPLLIIEGDHECSFPHPLPQPPTLIWDQFSYFFWPSLAAQTSDPPNHFWCTISQPHLFELLISHFLLLCPVCPGQCYGDSIEILKTYCEGNSSQQE